MRFLQFKYFLFSVLATALSFTSKAHFGYKGISEVGKVTCFAKKSDSSLFIGTATGGVFQSINTNLDSWVARPVGLASGKIVDLNYTGKYLFTVTVDRGVFRYSGRDGTDRYWEEVNSGIVDFSITSIISTDTSTLYAATSLGKLYKTNDKGEHWSELLNLPFVGMNVLRLVKAGKRIYVYTEQNGLYKSDDSGLNWIEFNSVNTQSVISKGAISYNSSSGEMMLSNSNGIFVLKNASGTSNPTFNQVSNTINATINRISSAGNAWFVASDQGIYATLNAPIQWVQFGLGGLNDTCNHIFPYYTKFVASTEHNGLFVLNSAGASWVSNNLGINNLKTISFAIRGENIIVAATEKGVLVSTDIGANYNVRNQGLIDSLYLTDVVFKNSKLFVSTSTGGVYLSLDTGKTWNPFVKGIVNLNCVKLFTSKKYIYLVNNVGEIYKTDGLNSWKISQNGLNTLSSNVSFTQLNTAVILSIYGQGVYKRNETEDVWQNITANLPTQKVTSVTYFGTKLFVGTEDQGVFVTDTSNFQWLTTSFSLTPKANLLNLNSLSITSMNAYKGYVFAGVKGAVFATSDDGKSWIDAGTLFNLPSYAPITKIGFTSYRLFVNTGMNFIYSNQLAELPSLVTITKINYPICGDSINELGKISVQYTGGYEPYTIKWNTNDSLSTITGLKPGKYVVTITDKNGASATDSVELVFKPCHPDTNSVPPVDTTKNVPIDSVKIVVVQDVMTLAPNPAIVKTKISFTVEQEIYQIRLYDSKGELVYQSNESIKVNSVDFYLNDRLGLFYLEVETKSGVHRQKITFI